MKTKKDENPKKELVEAPKTFTEGDKLPALATIEYGYKPSLGEVPELNLPSVLPNLPNVADLNWFMEGVASIAPSFPTSELPSVDQTQADKVNETNNEVPLASGFTTSLPPTSPVITSGPPPPAPPPPPPTSSGPPPPPPPGPPPSSVLPPVVLEQGFTESRSNLLADIRKGHKLKSSKKGKIKKTKGKKRKKKFSKRNRSCERECRSFNRRYLW